MTIAFHPDIATLMAFSAGTLEEPYAVVISTHLAMCEACREQLRRTDLIGGALLASEPTAPMSMGMLLRVEAGRKVPEHSHGGQELTLLLRGAYRDRFGRFAAGDIADHDEDVEHQPIAEPGEDCICLVAVDAKLSFRSRVVRFLQPLFGL